MADIDRFSFSLEAALRDLGAELDLPAAPDLAATVGAEIRRQQLRRHRTRTRLSMIAVAAAAALAALLAAVLPLTHEHEVPLASSKRPSVEVRLATHYGLGQPLDLDMLQQGAPFPVLLPTTSGFATPDEVYFRRDYPMDSVALVYHAAGRRHINSIITEFLGSPGGLADSLVASGAEPASVNDNSGAWVAGTGGPPVFFYFDPGGRAREVSPNLRANTLVWQQGELTLRFETELSKRDAIRVAESMAFRDIGKAPPRHV